MEICHLKSLERPNSMNLKIVTFTTMHAQKQCFQIPSKTIYLILTSQTLHFMLFFSFCLITPTPCQSRVWTTFLLDIIYFSYLNQDILIFNKILITSQGNILIIAFSKIHLTLTCQGAISKISIFLLGYRFLLCNYSIILI